MANLTESRAGAVDAADTERRRIERDLHDGAQQRLVSLAMNLGLARATLAHELSGPARQALQEAHQEAKEELPSRASWCADCTRRCSKTAAWTPR